MTHLRVPAALLAVSSFIGAAAVEVRVGDTESEGTSPVKLQSFGAPEQRGGRWCRNGDETGIGDNKAGYAAFTLPADIEPGLYECRMSVWGESSRFSFVAHNGTRYQAIDWGQPSGEPRWEEVRFVLRTTDLNADSRGQRFGFGSRDRQVWVAHILFRSLTPSEQDLTALAAARDRQPGRLVLTAAAASDAHIVVPSLQDKVVCHAAGELQKILLDMTGAYLPVVQEASAPRVLFAVDSGRFSNADGYAIKTSADAVRITGGSPLGTVFGAYAFLEQLGCRWLTPEPDGDVVPAVDTLVVPRLDIHEEPDFKIRWIGQGDWALKNRCNVNATVDGERVGHTWKWGFHSFYGLLPPQRYWDAHPEYYPLVGTGRRAPTGYSNTQICTTNREVVRTLAAEIIGRFQRDPKIDTIALGPNDGGGFCTCPRCIALDRPEPDFWGRYSDRLAPFNNAVAGALRRVCPDKLIKTGAYAMYMRYPVEPGYVPEPNIAVQACHTYACNNHPVDSACQRNTDYFRKPLETWAQNAEHLWIYEYYIKGAWASLLYTQTHVMAQDMAYYRRLGAEAFYTQWSAGVFRQVGLTFYVAARLAWDVDADVDAIIRDYCSSFYGPAGDAMVDFHKALERAFVESEDCISPFGYKRVWLAAQQVFTPRALAALEEHVARAETLADDPLVARRLESVRVTFEYTKRTVQYLRAVAACFDGVQTAQSPQFAAAEAKAREVGESMSEDVVKYLTENGLGGYVQNPRSKLAGLLRAHQAPAGVVLRWWQAQERAARTQAKPLPPVPGSRVICEVTGAARARLDPKDEGVIAAWFAPDCDDSQWRTVTFPSLWQDVGLAQDGYRGLGWYRIDFSLPAPAVPKGMRLMIRSEGIDAAATVYINGQRVGEHKHAAGSWETPFELDVTEHAGPGRNLLALRVYTGGGKGGAYGRIMLYRLGDEPEDFMR